MNEVNGPWWYSRTPSLHVPCEVRTCQRRKDQSRNGVSSTTRIDLNTTRGSLGPRKISSQVFDRTRRLDWKEKRFRTSLKMNRQVTSHGGFVFSKGRELSGMVKSPLFSPSILFYSFNFTTPSLQRLKQTRD